MREKQQTSFYGLGILVGVRNGQLTVISPLEGTPASRLGIQAGDVISTIEGEADRPMTLDDAVGKLKGPKGTQVKITIVRRGLRAAAGDVGDPGRDPADHRPPGLHAEPRPPATSSSPSSPAAPAARWPRPSTSCAGQGMKQLVLDLRNNGGGLLDQAIDVADQFLPEGIDDRRRPRAAPATRSRPTRRAASTRRSTCRWWCWSTRARPRPRRSSPAPSRTTTAASSSGTPSWGKGLVQTVYNLSYGAGLALTTAKYYTPSGRLIQRDYSSYYDYYTHADAGSPETHRQAGGRAKEVFHTDLGRKVYGGGGITPDVMVKDEELSPFEQFLAGAQRLPQLRGRLRQPQQGDEATGSRIRTRC